MPKVKTNSGAKKRFKLTATGNLTRKCAFKRHCLGTQKTKKQKRRLGLSIEVHKSDMPRMRKLLNI